MAVAFAEMRHKKVWCNGLGKVVFIYETLVASKRDQAFQIKQRFLCLYGKNQPCSNAIEKKAVITTILLGSIIIFQLNISANSKLCRLNLFIMRVQRTVTGFFSAMER